MIALVLRQSPTYAPEWVRSISRQIRATGYRGPITCLTNVSIGEPGVREVPLRKTWPGWWSKIELFRPGLFDGPTLYLDLDTLVLGDLSELLRIPSDLAMLSDFYQPTLAASGVIAWTPGPRTEYIYRRALGLQGIPNGRMDYWFRGIGVTADRIQDHAAGVYSLKAHARQGPPEGAVLVCGHGNPRFTSPTAGWAHHEWRRWL